MNIEAKMRRDWDRRARQHARFWIATEDFGSDEHFAASGEQTARSLLAQLPEQDPSWSVLEIGCGIGRVLRELSPRFARVCGVDVSQEMIEQSRRWLAGVSNVSTHANNGIDLAEYGDADFDLVYAYVAFQHMPRPVFHAYLRESNRVLAPQRWLVFQCYVGEAVDPPLDDTIGIRSYAVAEMHRALEDAGFACERAPEAGAGEMRSGWIVARKLGAPQGELDRGWQRTPCPDAPSTLDLHLQRCLAAAHERDGDPAAAAEVLAALVAAAPEQLEDWLILVRLLLESGQHARALASLEALVQAHPTHAPGHESLRTLRACLARAR